MQKFWWALSKGLFALLPAALAGYAVYGWAGLFAAVAAVLAVQLAVQLYYTARLSAWLAYPKSSKIPAADGLWGSVFDRLLAQNKSRKKRKQKLAQALQRFNRAAEAMPNAVMILDAEGRISWMNSLAVQYLNLDFRDWGGILHNVVRLPEFQSFLAAPVQEAAELKLTLPRRPVGERHLHCLLVPFERGSRLLIVRDVSEAEKLNATRTAFVANVSHELRTPLTVINGFLETIADMPQMPPEQIQQFVAIMRKEGSRMQTLLSDLLTLSRLESGVPGEPVPLDLSALAASLVEEGSRLSDGRHRIRSRITPDLWVNGVYTDLYNALSNIVFNAVRYTPAGGEIEVSLEPLLPGNPFMLPDVRFAVRDNGPGIAAEHLPHLAERFYRVDKGRSRQSGGTGLGLAITKHALAEHGAVLQIDSEVGVGSEFSTVLKQSAPA
ncbi:phosphate regulon sensor histidine kinase PhoR [Neisseria leonii]